MRMADAIEPGFFVEANRVDDKSIPIPMTDRIAHIRQTDVIAIRMLAPIDKDVADGVVILIKDKDLFRSLYDLQWKRLQVDSRHARRKTFGNHRIVCFLKRVLPTV